MRNHKLKALYSLEYVETLKRLHPELRVTRGMDSAVQNGSFEVGGPDRYQRPTKRPSYGFPAWRLAVFTKLVTIAKTYKGLLCSKAPADLVLYSALIWQLKPKTIIEFGSFHGGSGLWFADQMQAMCKDGDVHSFDFLSDCVSRRAKHPRLHFHQLDLNRLTASDMKLFRSFRHPWLVVDDAHVNVLNVLCRTWELMQPGDYFVKEDLDHLGQGDEVAEYMRLAESLGFWVDSIYADAFGVNYSSAQSAWFVLPPSKKKPAREIKEQRNLSWEVFT